MLYVQCYVSERDAEGDRFDRSCLEKTFRSAAAARSYAARKQKAADETNAPGFTLEYHVEDANDPGGPCLCSHH